MSDKKLKEAVKDLRKDQAEAEELRIYKNNRGIRPDPVFNEAMQTERDIKFIKSVEAIADKA